MEEVRLFYKDPDKVSLASSYNRPVFSGISWKKLRVSQTAEFVTFVSALTSISR